MRTSFSQLAVCVVSFGCALSCAGSPQPSERDIATRAESAAPSGHAIAPAPAPSTSVTRKDPSVLARSNGGMADVVVTEAHVYWLEVHSRPRGPRKSGSTTTSKGLMGFGGALMCDVAGGALMRVDRKTKRKETVAELDYRPFSLAYDGKRLYWTGAPCASGAARSSDPEWLWSWDMSSGGEPVALGDRDRNYLDMVTTKGAAIVSDRFGKGGAFRFVDGGSPEMIVPDSEQPWVVAADETSFFWADRSWTLWETNLTTRKATKHLSLEAMPSDAHLFDGGLVIRTTAAVLVLSRPAMKVEARVVIPDFGGRGAGALADGRHYLWADGGDTVSRLDLKTGSVSTARTGALRTACGVAFDAETLFLMDDAADAIIAWPSPNFVPGP